MNSEHPLYVVPNGVHARWSSPENDLPDLALYNARTIGLIDSNEWQVRADV